jgi:hypothetical protein
MAYVSQEFKKEVAAVIKPLLKKYGIKGSLSVDNHSTLVLTVKEGPIDFIQNYNETVSAQPGGFRTGSPAVDSLAVNEYWFHEHFTGVAKEFLTAAIDALKSPKYFDKSDIMTDYFHCSHYINLRIGKWDQPYKLV